MTRHFLASHKDPLRRQRTCARKGCSTVLRRAQCSVCSDACALAYMEQIADMYCRLEDYDPARFRRARTAAMAALRPTIDRLRRTLASETDAAGAGR